jgi:hypothetical protein
MCDQHMRIRQQSVLAVYVQAIIITVTDKTLHA